MTPYNTVAGSAQIITDGAVTIPTYSGSGPLYANGTYSNSYSWYASVPNARTAIGLSQDDKTLFLFTVDDAGGSQGMTVTEMANFMLSNYGVYEALNLDGGGSTTMAMADPTTGIGSVINASSNSGGPRAVGASLAIFAQPVPEPATITLLLIGAGAGLAWAGLRRRKTACVVEITQPSLSE